MDEKYQRGEAWLSQVMQIVGLPASVHYDEEQTSQDGSCWLVVDSESLSAEQIETLIGSHGEVLDSLQYLINTTLNLGKSDGQQQPYTVELNGYRARRRLELQAMAEQAAHRVRETDEEYEMAALSSAERRQVHTFLKLFDDLETYSRGQEPDRRLVVRRKSEET